jgi:hypothetical protein
MRRIVRVVLVGAAAAALLAAPVSASADSGIGRLFGQHVSMCAQDMGFSGIHNPGMHQGFAGWDLMHTC